MNTITAKLSLYFLAGFSCFSRYSTTSFMLAFWFESLATSPTMANRALALPFWYCCTAFAWLAMACWQRSPMASGLQICCRLLSSMSWDGSNRKVIKTKKGLVDSVELPL